MFSLSPKPHLTTTSHLFRASLLVSLVIFGSACSLSNSTTLKIDVPANFIVNTEAYYHPISNDLCYLSSDYAHDPDFGVKKFRQTSQPTAHTSQFKLKLLANIGGCLTQLAGIKFWIMDMTDDPQKLGLSAVGVHINDLADNDLPTPRPDEQLLWVDCRYTDSRISKVFHQELECKGLATNSEGLGVLKMEQLEEKTLLLRFRMTQ